MGDEQMKLWDDEPQIPNGDTEVVEKSLEPDIDKNHSEEDGEKDSVREYFESIAPKKIELTQENLGLYLVVEKAINKSKLPSQYDRVNITHYKKNILLFMESYMSQVLKDVGLQNEKEVIGDLLHEAISSGLIIKEGSQTKDHYDFYRLNPNVNRPKVVSEDSEKEAYSIFAQKVEAMSKNREKEKVTNITNTVNLQDTLTGFEWTN